MRFTSVAIPTIDQEAARDLVRVREDCRGGLMRPATASQSCLATPITFPTALVWLLEAAEDLLRDTPQRTSGIHNEVADHADMTDPTVLEPRPGDSPAY